MQFNGLSQFHRQIEVRILFVDVVLGVGEQNYGKEVLLRHTFSDVLHASCTHPSVEVVTVTSSADEIIVNAASDPLVQYFIYLIGRAVSYSYEGQFLAIKLAVDWRAI